MLPCAIYTTTAFVAEWLRRYVQVVVLSEGAGSSPVECIFLAGIDWHRQSSHSHPTGGTAFLLAWFVCPVTAYGRMAKVVHSVGIEPTLLRTSALS